MSTKKIFRLVGSLLVLVPEVLFSPSLVIIYSYFSNGKILRESYLTSADSWFYYLVLWAQIVGAFILMKKIDRLFWKVIFGMLMAIFIFALLLTYSFSSFGL
ncbi:MAG: hypothetical protein A2831_02480 [Candidatus Yanofskybacteria bacterium RIFCSPHIGHO2_01_FULL_44_17]|uniref:Uncharacterized protein n=1 Tax=Candidatus Yanofskybacteria bacterium RIFCSPHIGHO2_01_FULL_44_17 TaxID=1802668 RepID=A0A1F8EY41_9BACT|nr:MAG: hypothetical protein A2831_02480 [Candidatus Yanofskybacteria bacterium RIFCSPHIGHO2_01_FULL_44_17]